MNLFCGRFRNVDGGLIPSGRALTRVSDLGLGMPSPNTNDHPLVCIGSRVEGAAASINIEDLTYDRTAIDPGSLGGSPFVDELQMRMAMSALSLVRHVRVAVAPLLVEYSSTCHYSCPSRI